MMNLSTTITAMPAGVDVDGPKTTTGTIRDLQALTIPVSELIAKKPSASYRFLVESIASARDLVQRDLSGANAANARTKLPTYIEKRLGADGQWTGPVWTFIVWLPKRLVKIAGDGSTIQQYSLDHDNRGFCIDGESRAYALETMITNEPDPRRREHLLNIPIFLNIYDGLDTTAAAQHFRDINGLGVGINTSLLLGHDYADPWMRVTRKVFAELGISVEEESRQVKARSDKVLTIVAARGMVAAVARGIGAVAYGGGTIPEEIDGEVIDFDRLYEAAITWLTHVFGTLGVESFRDKGKVLRAAPVIAALGALGKSFYDGNLNGQLQAKAALASITDWSIGPRWNGIAGKMTPSGSFSVGSGKEAGHATFRAISDPTNPGYRVIRGLT